LRSLRNIFKELLTTKCISKKPENGYLMTWAAQGVFMLNAVLTVHGGNANSHQKKGWEEITSATIKTLSREREGIVFLCWGKPAAKMCESVSASKHTVIICSHPSPLGATKTASPFIGSDCFNRCNKALKESGRDEINWDTINGKK